jgi:D-alanyl-D-alanine dipeptidase
MINLAFFFRKSCTAMLKMRNFVFILVVLSGVAWLWKPLAEEPKILQARQLLLVTVPDMQAVRGTLQRYAKGEKDWEKVGSEIPVVVGRNGLAWGDERLMEICGGMLRKREGDGKAPAGIFRLSFAYGYDSASWDANVPFPYLKVNKQTLCIDDPASVYYNQIISTDTVAHPDWSSYEDMRRDDELYRYGLVVSYNTDPVRSGAGSCIFMHIGGERGTAGCTAMTEHQIKEIMTWLDSAAAPTLVQMTLADYKKIYRPYKLPKY